MGSDRVFIRCLLGLLFAGVLITSLARADATQETSQLFQYFSAGCASQGQWTSAALGYANDLITTIKSLAADPDCKTLSGALTQIQSVSSAAQLLTQDQNERTVASLQKQEQELLILVSQTTDPTQTAALVTQLQGIEVQIAQGVSFGASDNQFQSAQHLGQAMQTLVSGTNILLQQAAQNTTCLTKSNGLLTGIAGLAGSVDAVALSGTTSLLVGAGADILKSVIDSIRLRKLDKDINKIATAVSAAAYQCVLETLSNQWCSSQDALSVVKIEGDALTTGQAPTDLQAGIALLDQDTPEFLNWLSSVRAGTDPGNSAIASQQAQVLAKDEMNRAARVTGIGLVAQSQSLFAQTPPGDPQWNLELQVINSLVSNLTARSTINTSSGSLNISSPLADVLGPAYSTIAPWLLIGVPESGIPADPLGNPKSLLDEFPSLASIQVLLPGFKPDLGFVLQNMLAWIGLAEAQVATLVSTNLNLDPLMLVTSALTPNVFGNSPYLSLQKFLAFLSKYPSQSGQSGANGGFYSLYSDTCERLQAILCDIQAVAGAKPGSCPGAPAGYQLPPDAPAALLDISARAVLSNGPGFLGDRLQWGLRLSLDDLVRSNQGINSQQAAILVAGGDVIAELQTFPNTVDYNSMARDIENSQPVLQESLATFVDEFGKGIAGSIARFQNQAAETREGPNGPNNQAIAELCLKLLAAPAWPKDVPKSACTGKSLKSLFESGPPSVTITESLIAANFSDRACKFRDFVRSNSIFQSSHGQWPPRK